MYFGRQRQKSAAKQAIGLSVLLFASSLGAITNSLAAEDAINIGKISEELARNRKELKSSASSEVDAERERLRAEEERILNSLASGQAAPEEEPQDRSARARIPGSAQEQDGIRASISTEEAGTAVRRSEEAQESVVAGQGSARARSRSIFAQPFNGAEEAETLRLSDDSQSQTEPAAAPESAHPVAMKILREKSDDGIAERDLIFREEIGASEGVEAAAAKAVIKTEPAVAKPSKIDQLNASIANLRRQVEEARNSKAALQKELDETRNRLILAETEVERLSSIVDDRKRSTIARLTGSGADANAAPQAEPADLRPAVKSNKPYATRALSPAAAEKATSDMMIATVVADKAALRAGPGKNNSQLLAVSKGTRLAVETRQGEWYRVITPTGARAWVSATVVAFGPGGKSDPTRTLRGAGYNMAVEDEALKLLRQP